MTTAEDLKFGRKKARTKVLPYDRCIHYQGTWPYGARERFREGVSERLNALLAEKRKALAALAAWRGQEEN